MRFVIFSAALLVLIFASGCATQVGRFKLGTTGKWAPNDRLQSMIRPLNDGKEVSGTSCGHYFFMIPLVSPSATEAYDKAVSQVRGTQGLSDAKIQEKNKFLSLIYNVSCYEVTGTPISFKKVASK